MTAEQIFKHPNYQDSNFSFTGERWSIININGFSKYRMSNFYRIKNAYTGHILKPSSRRNSTKYVMTMYKDSGKVVRVNMDAIFDGFNVLNEKRRNGKQEFIYDAF